MRDGTCIKCGSNSVRQLTGGIDRGNNTALYVRGGMINRASSYESFLCSACGYYENYVTDLEKLRNVAAGEGGWAPPTQ